MLLKKMYRRPARLLLGLGLAAFTTFLGACKGDGNNSSSTKDSTQKAGTQSGAAADPGLTLPVLDALFYEEGFSGELKSKLQLSDGQVQKLKTTAHAAVEELYEDGAGDHDGSSRAAAQKAEAQIRSILGDAKTGQLFQLLAQRYAEGVEGMMPAAPNAVPTDTRIVVNAAAYRMDVYKEGKLLKTYKVGIGYPEFPLPTGMRRAGTIIFNPTWTPPDEPWVRGKVQPGKKVEAGSALNPLGPIKIPIGLPNLIHGGKQPDKLGNFASHGCVGLTNEGIQDFAMVMAELGGSPLSADSVRSFGTNRTKTNNFKLARPVAVELRYETIVAEGGAIHVYRDVYERGSNTPQALQQVLDVYGLKFGSLPAPEQQTLTAALSEMNRDARGNPVADFPGSSDTATGQSGTESRSQKGKVTSTVQGRREVVVPIAALKGKGYPAPVNMVAPATASR